MTKAIHRNLLKDEVSSTKSHLRDECGAITDHLRNHVHLTNCIHLKNHMHRHSPNIAEKSLIRDLLVLQRSRSLRDPSTSPPSWVSPSIVTVHGRRGVRDGLMNSGRGSVGVEKRKELGRLSTSSTAVGSVVDTKGPPVHGSCNCNEEQSGEEQESKTEEVHQKSREILSDKRHSYEDSAYEGLSKNVKGNGRKKTQRSSHGQATRLKTLSEQLEEVVSQANSGKKKSSDSHQNRYAVKQGIPEGPRENARTRYNGLNKGKKRRLKGKSHAKGSTILEGVLPRIGRPAASSFIPQGSVHHKDHIAKEYEEDTELDASQAARNVCGIPWNWSRIHHKSRNVLDKAGRSLACGLSDPILRKEEPTIPEDEPNVLNMPITSGQLTSSASSDSEMLPLLTEASDSQASGADRYHLQDYSGELGIFSNHSLRYERDSDLASEVRTGHHRTSRTRHRHRSLTQKYMPKTFKDLVGQNLVAQALSNAVSRQKVGAIYVFYGPHGTGKTSCAYVFAKALNCHSVDHPRPCDVCSSCISHNLGRSRDVIEVGPVGNYDFESIMDVFENVLLSPRSSRYKVFIIDDCDTLPQNLWSVITKVIDRAPRHVVFVLVSLNLDHLPHIIISRCQKFFFPKLKDSDIISTLQWISSSEGLEIDKDAVKLIASRSDGSLRDAEMTLDQLTLLGQKITLSLVQELVGLVSDEKLVDLLDLALSADAVNTVKTLREIMESGVEPLALMSQLATVITDILAGSYVFNPERRRKFFRHSTLSKKDMEKLRQALKTLSEAEKQLRVSNDKMTWLTAALLQLAPDQQYMQPISSADRSATNSPLVLNDHVRGGMQNSAGNQYEMHATDMALLVKDGTGSYNRRGGNAVHPCALVLGSHNGGSIQVENSLGLPNDYGRVQTDNRNIWKAVLENIRSDSLRQFLSREGKLNLVKLGTAPTVQLSFSSSESRSKAEKFRGQILEAFESLLSSSVTLEIRGESRNEFRSDVQRDPVLPTLNNGSSMMASKKSHYLGNENPIRRFPKERWSVPHVITEGEIIETRSLGEEYQRIEDNDKERWGTEEPHHNKSIIRGKVSLAHVIQQAESSQRGGWSRRKAMSIAEKLEQENLRLEPRARGLLCWKASSRTGLKLAKLRIRPTRPRSLLKLVTCGRCLSGKSPR